MISDIIRMEGHKFTPQQLADMADAEDRAARAAHRRGDNFVADTHDTESAKLCQIINEMA